MPRSEIVSQRTRAPSGVDRSARDSDIGGGASGELAGSPGGEVAGAGSGSLRGRGSSGGGGAGRAGGGGGGKCEGISTGAIEYSSGAGKLWPHSGHIVDLPASASGTVTGF